MGIWRRFALIAAGLTAAIAGLAAPAFARVSADVTWMSSHLGSASGGRIVHIHGTHLGRTYAVAVGAQYATRFHVVSDHEVVATMPAPHRDKTTHIVAFTRDAGHTSWSDPQAVFRFVLPPTITGLSSYAGPIAGTRIAAYGTDFISVRSVTVDGIPAGSPYVFGPTKVSFQLPSHRAGNADIRITTDFGTSTWTAKARYTYVNRPVVSGLASNYGSATPSRYVTVWGQDLSRASAVLFDGRPARIVSVRGTDVIVNPPPHPAATVHVSVVTPGGASAPTLDDRYTYTGPATMTWSVAPRRDVYRGTMQDISCPVSSFCAAVDGDSAYVLSGGTWGARVQLSPYLAAVACSSPTYCLAGGSAAAYEYRNGSWAPTSAVDPAYLAGLNCPSDGTCTGWDQRGEVFAFSAGTWTSLRHPDGSRLLSAAWCGSTTWCLATGTGTDVFEWDGTSWSSTTIDSHGELIDLSCAGPSLCAAVDRFGYAVTWDGSTWSQPVSVFDADSDVGGRHYVDCARTSGCAAISGLGYAAHFDGRAWTTTDHAILSPTLDEYDPLGLVNGVACGSATNCVAIGGAGETMRYAAGNWSEAQMTFETGARATSISCPTTAYCAMSDADGDIFTWDGATWGTPQRPVHEFASVTAVSCASSTSCVMVAPDGGVATFDGNAWTAGAKRTTGDRSIDCVTPAFCVTPTGVFDGASWTSLTPAPVGSRAHLSCASTAFCVAVGAGRASVFDGTTWGTATVFDTHDTGFDGNSRVSCPSVGYCVAESGRGYQSVLNHGAWSVPIAVGYATTRDVSCATPTFCGRADGSNALDVFDGTTFSDPTSPFRLGAYITTISCPTPDLCVGVGFSDTVVGRRM